jgi:hypothetical protein
MSGPGVEQGMSQLIEDCLRAAGVRFFRGHHSDEYFFLVGARHRRLHIHLAGGSAGAVTLTITPDRYYPANLRDQLQTMVRATAAAELGEVRVRESCDPALVGVVAQRCWQPSDAAALRADVEAALTAALEMFAQLGELAAGTVAPTLLRDAG